MNRHRARPRKQSPWRVVWNATQMLVICGLAVFSGLKAYEYSRQQQYLVVKNVVVTGNARVPTEELLDLAQVPVGVPLYSAETEAIEQGVLSHPDVSAVRARRVPPDTLHIEVSEHQGVATLAVGDGVYILNREARLFRRVQAGEALDLPVITGIPRDLFGEGEDHTARVAQAMDVLRAYVRAGRPLDALQEIEIDEHAGAILRLGDLPTEVTLGREDLDEKFVRLSVLEKHLGAHQQQAERIHIDNERHPERVAVLLHQPILASASERDGSNAKTHAGR